MANNPAPALELRDGDADELDQLLRSTTAPAGLARRARIVMLAADGMANTRISEVVGVSVPTVLTVPWVADQAVAPIAEAAGKRPTS